MSFHRLGQIRGGQPIHVQTVIKEENPTKHNKVVIEELAVYLNVLIFFFLTTIGK